MLLGLISNEIKISPSLRLGHLKFAMPVSLRAQSTPVTAPGNQLSRLSSKSTCDEPLLFVRSMPMSSSA